MVSESCFLFIWWLIPNNLSEILRENVYGERQNYSESHHVDGNSDALTYTKSELQSTSYPDKIKDSIEL